MVEPTSRPTTTPSLSERLLVLFNGRRLSPTQRRIAQYFLDHSDAAFLSSTELAQRTGVSQPSVIRFATALGFSGYPDLRRSLRRVVLESSPDAADDVRRNELQAIVADDQATLASLHDSLARPRQVLEVAEQLAQSSPLTVLGFRVSAALASFFTYGARRIHPDVRLIAAGHTAAIDALMQSRQAGGSWLLAFALPRVPVETVDAIRLARSLGMRTAVVTDTALVDFANDADVWMPVGVGARGVFDSQAAAMTLAAALMQAMADAAPERTQERLEAFEQMAESRGFFIDSPAIVNSQVTVRKGADVSRNRGA